MSTQLLASPTRARPGRDRTTKGAHAYAALKEAILSGAIAPGALIDKPALCRTLGVSRFPVTTAVNRLAFEHLVLIEPQHGSFVAKLVLGDVLECMMIRNALEAEIAAAAATRPPAGLAAALDRNLRYQAVAAASGDAAGFYALDVGFHAMLSETLGLAHAADILDGLRSRLERMRRLLSAPPGRLAASLAEHRGVAAAIVGGDPDAARAAMRAHLAQTTALFRRFAETHAPLFADRT